MLITRRHILQAIGTGACFANGLSLPFPVDAAEAQTIDWSGNDLGVTSDVLPPWSPLKQNGLRVSCWGRDYDFTNAALLSQLVNQGRGILRAPASLTIQADGFSGSVSNGAFRVIGGNQASLELEGEAVLGPFSIRQRIGVEYDGLVTVRTTIQSEREIAIRALWLDIPLSQEHARYIHYASSHNLGKNFSSGLPETQGRVWTSSTHPYLWLGDDERGLAWFADSFQGWHEPMLEVIRQGNTVLIRIHVITSPIVRRPLTFAFGLQGTPVKPVPENWRLRRLTSGLGGADGTDYIVWPIQMDPLSRQQTPFYPYHSFPMVAPEFLKLADFLHKKGKRVIAYMRVTHVSTGVPGYDQHENEIILRPKFGDSTSVIKKMQYPTVAVCPGSKKWQDAFLVQLSQLLRTVPVDGFYFDTSIVRGCENLQHGHGYRDDRGRIRKTWPFLAYRDFHRRIYALCQAQKRDIFIMVHTSERMTIPAFAFADAYLEGEQFGNPHYLKMVHLPILQDEYLFPQGPLSINMLRAEFMGKQWGLAPYFLPEFASRYRQPEPTESLLCLLALHDIAVWGLWCHAGTVERYMQGFDRFGMRDVAFVPYWKQSAVTASTGSVAVSLYRKPGRTLLVVGNLGFESQESHLTLRPLELGSTDSSRLVVSDLLNGDKIKVDSPSHRITLRLPKRGLRLIQVATG